MSRSDPIQIVELRRYALHPGARDTLVELFDRELVESQEDVGMQVLGQFRDLDDPDSFVWLRGFADMDRRREGLEAFYGGPVWKAHSRAANATMIDSDNVLLLRPLSPLRHDPSRRAAQGSTAIPPGLVAITIWPLAAAEACRVLQDRVVPALRDAGVTVPATFATEHSENTFPALPVRENEEVVVCVSLFEDEADHSRSIHAFEGASRALAPHLAGEAETLRLSPTARSALHRPTR